MDPPAWSATFYIEYKHCLIDTCEQCNVVAKTNMILYHLIKILKYSLASVLKHSSVNNSFDKRIEYDIEYTVYLQWMLG